MHCKTEKKFKQVKTTCKTEQSSYFFNRPFSSGLTSFKFYFEKFNCNFAILTLYCSKISSKAFDSFQGFLCFLLHITRRIRQGGCSNYPIPSLYQSLNSICYIHSSLYPRQPQIRVLYCNNVISV